MSNIMIIGGAGFIGSHLADAFLREGKHKVITIDNLLAVPDIKNLQFARNHKNDRHTFYLLDAFDDDMLRKVFKIESPDIIINLTGSRTLYLVLQTIIDKQKLVTLCDINDTSVSQITIRTDMVFGGRQYNGPVKEGCFNILNNKALEVNSDKVHEWTYINDLVKGIKLIIDRGEDGDYTISSNWAAPLAYIYNEMNKVAGNKFEQLTNSAKPYLDTTLIRQLGWKPTHSLEDNLEATMAWYQLHRWAFRQENK